MTRTTWIWIVIVLAGAAAVWLFGDRLTPASRIEAATARRQPIQTFVDEQAMTRLPETFLITMPSAGRIEPIELKEGTPVRKGEVVARIVPADLTLAVEEAQATVARLEAAIRQDADLSMEQTALEQALRYVDSMNSAVQAAAAREESGLAKFDYAERFLGRAEALSRTHAVSQDDLDRARLQQVQSSSDYRQDVLVHASMRALQAATNLMPTLVRQYIARKSLNQAVLMKQKAEAEARLGMVQLNQSRGTMTSPVDGVVLKRVVTNELYLPAGTTLLDIGRLQDMQVEADVLSIDVVDVKVGNAVEVYGPAIGGTARGLVRQIYPAGFTKVSSLGVEQQRVKVVVAFEPDELARLLDQRRLGIGYRVRVRIRVAEKPEALVIPRSALFRNPAGQWQVYAVQNGRASLQEVTLGLMNDQQAEVLKGLEPNAVVIVAPENNLAQGQRVEAVLPK